MSHGRWLSMVAHVLTCYGAGFGDMSLICGKHEPFVLFLAYMLHPFRPSCLTRLHSRRPFHHVLFHETTTRNERLRREMKSSDVAPEASASSPELQLGHPPSPRTCIASHDVTTQFCLMPSVPDRRLARLFDGIKCDVLTKNQEAGLEEISRTFHCELLVLLCPVETKMKLSLDGSGHGYR